MRAVSPASMAAPDCIVVFSGHAGLWWQRALKPGFRHCFCLIRDGGDWLIYEPLSNRTLIGLARVAPGWNPQEWLSSQGYRHVAVAIGATPRRPLPMLPFTCVEAVKRVLGLRSWRIWTPWQLHRALAKQA